MNRERNKKKNRKLAYLRPSLPFYDMKNIQHLWKGLAARAAIPKNPKDLHQCNFKITKDLHQRPPKSRKYLHQSSKYYAENRFKHIFLNFFKGAKFQNRQIKKLIA